MEFYLILVGVLQSSLNSKPLCIYIANLRNLMLTKQCTLSY